MRRQGTLPNVYKLFLEIAASDLALRFPPDEPLGPILKWRETFQGAQWVRIDAVDHLNHGWSPQEEHLEALRGATPEFIQAFQARIVWHWRSHAFRDQRVSWLQWGIGLDAKELVIVRLIQRQTQNESLQKLGPWITEIKTEVEALELPTDAEQAIAGAIEASPSEWVNAILPDSPNWKRIGSYLTPSLAWFLFGAADQPITEPWSGGLSAAAAEKIIERWALRVEADLEYDLKPDVALALHFAAMKPEWYNTGTISCYQNFPLQWA